MALQLMAPINGTQFTNVYTLNVDGEAGVLVATTADTTTDATTLGVANGDTVIFIGPTNLVQAIVSANTFPSAPAVGDMLIHYKPV